MFNLPRIRVGSHQIFGFGLMKMPLRWFLLAVVTFLAGVTTGLEVTDQLEPFLEPILVYLFPEPAVPSLVPVNFDPFDPCLWGAVSPHDLCV